MYCPKCNVNRPGDGKFCVVCGTALTNSPVTPPHKPNSRSPLVGILAVLLVFTLSALAFCIYLLVSGTTFSDLFAQLSLTGSISEAGTEESLDSEAQETQTESQEEEQQYDIEGEAQSDTEETPYDTEAETAQYDIPTEGTLEYNGHTYYVYGGVVNTWEEAEQYCEERGGYLAVINNQAENDALYAYACSGAHPYAFFGYSDAITEDVWEWVENDQSTYTNWGVNGSGEQQPNSDSSAEDYAEFAYGNGTWNDSEFGHDTNRFICEWDIVLTD